MEKKISVKIQTAQEELKTAYKMMEEAKAKQAKIEKETETLMAAARE